MEATQKINGLIDNLVIENNTVTLVCGGDVQCSLPNEIYVYVSPITAWRVVGWHNPCLLLGDYSPDEQTAQDADESVYFQIETCLQLEAETDLRRRWWPLAYRRLMARLSRYRWLKWCLREVVRVHRASFLRVTSDEDRDLVMAARAVGEEEGMSVEILAGMADPPLNIDHMIRQTGLALRIDPAWLTHLQAFSWKFHSSRTHVAYQPYWNLNLPKRTHCSPLFLNRIVSLAATISSKLAKFGLFRRRYLSSYYDLWASDVIPEKLSVHAWAQYFSSDERTLIAQALGTFIKEYPPSDIDRAGNALKCYLRAKSVQTVVLMHDKLDSCRLLAWAAHAVGVRVDYLPHGLVFEDAAGQKSSSLFSPDRILAWNITSANAVGKYGWSAEVIAHPHFDRPIPPFKSLKKDWKRTQVLVLLADWVYLTEAGREDCAWIWYRDILDSMHRLGVDDANIHIKMHQFNKDATSHYDDVVTTLTSLLNFRPQWVPQTSRVSDILPAFDLVVCGLTTGIYECIMHGIPHVVYGMSAQRVGVLRGINVPHARNSQELLTCLANYDNEHAAHASAALMATLKEGKDLEMCA